MFHQKAFSVKGLPTHSAAVRCGLFVVLILILLTGQIVWRSRAEVLFRNVLWSGRSARQRFFQSLVHRGVVLQMFFIREIPDTT